MAKTIEYYEIIGEIASGGFGKVYLASHTRAEFNGLKCVIKKFSPIQIDTFDDETKQDMRKRFAKEAEILRELSEKCYQIPKFYEHFSEDGEHYIVQEYIVGKTLAKHVKENGPFDERTVRRILDETLEILEIVHNHGLIHRDVTPDNLMLREEDNKIVLLDFGSVKNLVYTVKGPDGTPLDLTIPIGKQYYTPSEQWMGRPVNASDLYSLGLTAIYLLTGVRPRDLDQDHDNKVYLWHRYAPRTSEQIRSVINKATDDRWKNRYQSASEMRVALEKTQFSNSLLTLKFTNQERHQWALERAEREHQERVAWEIVERYLTQLERQEKAIDRQRHQEDALWKARVREARKAIIMEQQSLKKEEKIRAKLESFHQFFHTFPQSLKTGKTDKEDSKKLI